MVSHAGAARARWTVGVAAAALLSLPGATGAQTTASEIVPESFRPVPDRRLDGAIVFTGQPGVEAPPGAEQLSILIRAVEIEDAIPELAAANAAYRARLTRGRIAASEIFEATASLEADYAEAGFVLTRVVIPVQSLRDGGTLRVAVVDGFVERIDTTNVDPRVAGPIEASTLDLIDRTRLRLGELERGILLAGDVPGVALRSALVRGERPGGTVIALEADYRPVTGFLGFDNALDDELGPLSFDAGLEFNSPFGIGEVFYLRFGGTPEGWLGDDPVLRTLALGAALPVGSRGTTLNVEATRSETGPDVAGTSSESLFERQSLRIVQPVRRTRDLDAFAQLTLDVVEDSLQVAGAPVYRDEIAVLRFGGTLAARRPSGAFVTASATLSRGLDAFGARGASDVGAGGTPLSRQGADATFTKLNLSASYAAPLGDQFSLSVGGRAQVSFGDALVTSERFGIGGGRDLSAFDSGDLRGDSGWLLRGELGRPVETQLAGLAAVFTPYAFAAVGAVEREAPTAVETSRTRASTVGIGMDLSADLGSPFSAASLRIEYGTGDRDDGGSDDKVSVFGSYRF